MIALDPRYRPVPSDRVMASFKVIGHGKFYITTKIMFLIRSNLRSQGVKKVKFSQNRAIFAENRNYLNNYTS